VQVVDDEDRRFGPEPLEHRGEDFVGLVGVAEKGLHRSAELRGHVVHGSEWSRRRQWVAGSPQHGRVPVELVDERLDEHALAAARLAGDDDHPAFSR
jgi:hypothetical protein